MATRSGGISGAVYALVIFVFLFVIGASLSVLFYTQKNKAEQELAQALTDKTKDVRSAERTGDAYLTASTVATGEGRSVFAQMRANQETLARLFTGDGATPIQQIKNQLDAVGIGEGKYAISKIQELMAANTASEQTIEKLVADRKKVEDKISQLESSMNTEAAKYSRQIGGLDDKLKEQKTDYDKNVAAVKAEREQLLATYEKAKEDARAALRDKEAQLQGLKNDIAKRDARIAELARIIQRNRLTAPDMTLEYDAKVIEFVPRDNLVFINLGRDDRLILGMTFEVFDQATGVQTQVERNGQLIHVGGKATVEVVRFSESGETTACRIVRQAFGRPIVTGDIVSNIVYDKNRTYRFFVYGDFDIDGDRRATPSERQRLLQLIEQWGGEVVSGDRMPVDTDFLVLGRNVEYPADLPDDPPPTIEQIAERDRQLEQFKRYAELSGQAAELSIPVLNQNRFMTLIGYYQQ